MKGAHGLLQFLQVFRFSKNCKIHIPAKFRSSVKYARLTAHEQAADAMRFHRRKDFQCRVRVQGILQASGRCCGAVRTHSSAPRESVRTNSAILMECRNPLPLLEEYQHHFRYLRVLISNGYSYFQARRSWPLCQDVRRFRHELVRSQSSVSGNVSHGDGMNGIALKGRERHAEREGRVFSEKLKRFSASFRG